jgi:uncharacterized membrane protein YeaQ/YmgE (transglycosylase-associated protein family)
LLVFWGCCRIFDTVFTPNSIKTGFGISIVKLADRLHLWLLKSFYIFKTNIMEGQAIIITLILGAVAGWLGGQLFKGSGLGLLGNIVVGILGGFVGYWLFGLLHISLGTGWLGYIFTAGIGACVLLAVLNLLIPRRI